jgi:hypothetical protein
MDERTSIFVLHRQQRPRFPAAISSPYDQRPPKTTSPMKRFRPFVEWNSGNR